MPQRYLLTSALPYANGPLHLGHLAGAYLPGDIHARFLRLLGKEVVYICGSDEHGAAITIRAKKEGRSPQDIIDTYHTLNQRTFAQLGISFDYYHRTSAELHHRTAQEFFISLYERGDQFEARTNEQYYDAEYDQFLADRYIKGICPKCNYPEAHGDQCENCGSDLSPTELIDPVSTLSGKAPVLRETTHWYFKLDQHADWLRTWIEDGTVDGERLHDPKKWRKHVIGQCLSWLDDLHPRAITRDLDWGVRVPLPEAEGKVLYVWFDAPIGYISATKAWAEENGKDWKSYWQDASTELVHFIGKDNIVFHTIIFPAMLRAHGDYILPKNVPANQFLNFEGQKFSKSRNWGIEQHEYLEAFAGFPNKEDALRYALIRNMPETKDADFLWDEFIEYHDKELADKLGNFINRVVVLTHKYYGGEVPTVADPEAAREALAPAAELARRLVRELEAFSPKSAVQTFMELASWGNVYLQEVSPWKLYKAEPDSEVIKECLFVSAQVVALLGVLAEPFIPFTSPRIRRQLGQEPVTAGALQGLLTALDTDAPLLPAGHRLGEAEILFAKIVDRKDKSRLALVDAQRQRLQAVLTAEQGATRAPVKPEIQFDDFTKLDIRTGTITAAEKVKKADKLLKLTVDLGNETRTVVSGIAQHYAPEAVVGQEVLVLVNLAPRKLRGIESQGMILMAEDAEGKLVFAGAEGAGNGFAVS